MNPSDTIRLSDTLTDRQREVIALVCEGLSNQQIAGRLFIQPSTVEQHLTASYSKLGISGRRELAGGHHR